MAPTTQTVWPAHDGLRVIAEDEALLVVDKPSGVSALASERGGDDMVTRVRAVRDEPYLGVLQRLERDVSGAMVFTRNRRFNAAIAPQFERNTVTRTYLVALEGWPAKEPKGSLVSRVVPDGEGGFLAVEKPTRGEQRVSFNWRIEAREGTRTLLAITPTAGTLAMVRAQLAGVGNAIVGDARHGGAPYAVPLLHLAALGIEHPGTTRRVRYEATRPARFDRWLHGDVLPASIAAWRERMLESIERRFSLAHTSGLDAYRLGNDVGDDLPGVTVDRYGDYALAQFYTPEATEARDAVLDAIASLGAKGVFAKYRPRQSNTLVETRRDDLAPAHALRGNDAPDDFAITEHGLTYRVRLGDGLSTGIFLDQRENRAFVRSHVRDARVLNLFAYTCAFTVASAAGGARSTVSVDVSAGAMAIGRENLVANHLDDAAKHTFSNADVFGWLEGAIARGDLFDLVILDPPSYSTTKDGSRFSAESDYRSLAALALRVVAPGGRLLACSNHRGITHARLRRQLQEACVEAGCASARQRDLADPVDFPGPPGRECHLKSIVVELAPA